MALGMCWLLNVPWKQWNLIQKVQLEYPIIRCQNKTQQIVKLRILHLWKAVTVGSIHIFIIGEKKKIAFKWQINPQRMFASMYLVGQHRIMWCFAAKLSLVCSGKEPIPLHQSTTFLIERAPVWAGLSACVLDTERIKTCGSVYATLTVYKQTFVAVCDRLAV